MNAIEFAWIVGLYIVTRRLFIRIVQLRVNKSEKGIHGIGEKNLQEDVRTAKESIVEVVKDDCCGTYISKDNAYKIVEENGQTRHFCSWDCRQKYVQEHR